MATTRTKLAEEAERLLMQSYDSENIKPRLERRLTSIYVDQAANAILGLRLLPEAKIGIVDIPSSAIATYTGIAATQSAPYTAKLPVFPITLPLDMGIWSVKSSAGLAYIPIKTEMYDLVSGLDEGLLEGQVGYYVRGREIRFTGQPTATVDIELIIIDPSLLGPYDPYPISADMEAQVLESVVNLLRSNPLAPEKPKN